MEYQDGTPEIGEQLGFEGVEQVVRNVERYCEFERQRIELTNQARIVALRAEGALLLEQERDIKERLRQALPLGDLRIRRRKALYYGAVTLILTVAGFFFSLLAFDPYRLGWKSYLYCLGIAVVTPFCVEKCLDAWDTGKLFKTLATAASVSALASLVLLAVIRGDVLTQEIRNTAPVVDFGEDDPVQTQPAPTFYDETLVLLRFVMALLSLAMELGAGLALRDARRLGTESGEDPAKLSAELKEVRQQMVSCLNELTAVENESGIFAARFWRNFYRAMLTHTARRAMTKLLVLLFTLPLLAQGRAVGQNHVTLVVAVDLTQSVAVTGPSGETEFHKNINAVTRLLAHVPADSRVTILGITDRSFAEPDIMLSATIRGDPGYFNERLRTARAELVRAWKSRSAQLEPRFRHTDVLGALLVASELFKQQPDTGRKMLVMLSDMRHRTPNLDLESPAIVPAFAQISRRTNTISGDLHGVRVFALGVDGAGKQMSYWESLKQFWVEYFRSTGATLGDYSVLREVPAKRE